MFCRTTKWLGGLRQIAFLSFPEPQVHSYVYVAILYSGSMSRLWSRYLGLSLGFVFPRDVILDKLIIPFSLHFLIYKMKIIIASNTTGWLWELNEISSVQFSHSVVSDSLWPHGLQHARLLYPWNFPGKNTGVGCLLLLGLLLTQGLNPESSALQADSLPSEPAGKPVKEQLNQVK